eukprot:COSAG06_NODE_1128_length_10601_cov_13.337460_9_plen_97_part_00
MCVCVRVCVCVQCELYDVWGRKMIGTIKGGRYTTEVRKRFFGDYSFEFKSIMLKCIILPRQAREQHRENSKKTHTCRRRLRAATLVRKRAFKAIYT